MGSDRKVHNDERFPMVLKVILIFTTVGTLLFVFSRRTNNVVPIIPQIITKDLASNFRSTNIVAENKLQTSHSEPLSSRHPWKSFVSKRYSTRITN